MPKLVQFITYIDPKEVKKMSKKKGDRGLISWSAYLRALVMEDLDKT